MRFRFGALLSVSVGCIPSAAAVALVACSSGAMPSGGAEGDGAAHDSSAPALDSSTGSSDAASRTDASDAGSSGLDGALDAGGSHDGICPPGAGSDTLDLTAVTVDVVPMVPPDDGFAPRFEILEGPVWIEPALYLSHFDGGPTGGRILRFVPGDPSAVVVADAATNGLAYSAGQLLAARYGDGSLSQFDLDEPTRAPVRAVAQYAGNRFNSPNDLVVASTGDIYFTDPDWQAPDPNPQPEERTYHVRDGVVVDVIAPNVQKPNGITLSPSERQLFVGGTNGLFVYPVDASGDVGSGLPVGEISGGVDGLGRDCARNLYVTTAAGVVVLDAAMARVGLLSVEGATNVAFGGADRRTLFITTLSNGGAARLYEARLNVPGYPY